MTWFRRRLKASHTAHQKLEAVPDGLWTKCLKCTEIIFNRDLEKSLKVCPKCGYHFRLSARVRLAGLIDPDTFVEYDAKVVSGDPLGFPEYPAKLARDRAKVGMPEAVVTGEGRIEGLPAAVGITDSGFLMGSMGSAVGEKLARAMEAAASKGLPLVAVCGSGGGARMHEGLFSLMQMAKTTAAAARLHQAGCLFVSVLTDPSMAGVLASWASVGDIIIAEPGALIGFTGQRVSRQAQVIDIPEDFQLSEFQRDHGMVDMVVARGDLKPTLARLISFFHGEKGA